MCYNLRTEITEKSDKIQGGKMSEINLYIIRHGIAVDPAECSKDADRALTKEGDRKTRRIAQRLKELSLKFDIILTSPLVRARQTGQILLEEGLSSQLEEFSALAPAGDIKNWLTWLEITREKGVKEIAIVGHEPNLSQWAETLIWGEAKGVIILKKAGIIGLNLPETGSPVGNSEIFWLTPPKFFIG
jgi:phosphohistidine phosphatase